VAGSALAEESQCPPLFGGINESVLPQAALALATLVVEEVAGIGAAALDVPPTGDPVPLRC
jgi:hypothetical protein